MIVPLLFLSIFILSIYIIARPFLIQNLIEKPNDPISFDPVDSNRKNILQQIQELEFEYNMKLISNEDFQRIKAELLNDASNLIEEKNIPPKQNSIKPNYKFCTQCGNKLNKNDKYCSNCGYNLSKAE